MKPPRFLAHAALIATLLALTAACSSAPSTPAAQQQPAANATPGASSGAAAASPQPTAQPAESGAPKQGGTLRVAFADWPKNLHPQIDSGTEGLYVQVNITESLVNIDPNGEIVPGLATALPERPDDLTYVFTLRQGVTFHDGTEFDADDVIWTFDRLLGKFPDQQSTQAARYKSAIASVEALDEYTVKIVLTKPWDDFLTLMAGDKYMDIMSREAVEQLGEDYGLSGAVGTGPFKFQEWVKGDHITIVRNDDYWGEKQYLDAITYRAIPEESARLIALKTGEVDVLLSPPLKDIEELSADPAYQVQQADSGDMKVFFLNSSREPFTDIRVRQALFYAIDRQAIMDSVYYGLAPKGQGIFPPWHWAYDPNADFYPYDPERARQLLAEAGYSDANPLQFEIVSSSTTEYVDTATLIQSQLAQIGVQATVNSMEAAAFTAKTFSQGGKPNPGYQAAVYRFIFGSPTTDFSWRVYHSQTAINQFGYNQEGGYQRPEMDKMLDDAWVLTDREAATEAYREISKTITEDALLLTLGWLKNVNVSHSYVKGLGIYVRDDFPMTGVWLDK